LGATYKGQKIGSTGADITCFSFSPHMKQTVSNGGMLVTDDEEMMERARLLRHHAMVVGEDELGYIYDVVNIGSKYTMSAIEAAFNDAFLSHQDQVIERHKVIAERYSDRLKAIHHVTIPEVHGDHAFTNYIIKIDKNRDGFARDLLAKGIETGLHYIPLHLMSYYKNKYTLRINDFPVALRNYQQILSLPIYGTMTDKEVDYVCDTIIELAETRV
jgi:dTDP-4-amino-4,6-dideoxygalactose transaminase